MTSYVAASALLKRYVAESDFDRMALIACDPAVCVAATSIAETLAVPSRAARQPVAAMMNR